MFVDEGWRRRKSLDVWIGRGKAVIALLSVRIVLAVLTLLALFDETTAQPFISDQVLKSVIQIVTPQQTTGTGFLVAVPSKRAEQPTGVMSFLVTNKHMLGNWNPIDGDFDHYDSITIHLYRTVAAADPPVQRVHVPLKTSEGKLNVSRVAFHADKRVDVAIVRIDDVARQHFNKLREPANMKVLTSEWLEPFANLPGKYGYIGAQIFALGYPHGITSLLTNNPVAKVGHLSATAGEELALRTQWVTRAKQTSTITLRGKLILVDGLIVGGNSGGPIVLPSSGIWGRDPKTGETVMGHGGSSKVWGIVSSGVTPAGLSWAYATDYITSLIEVFLKS
jgi:hypothetical protein